jgi:hypothetical protein
VASPVPARWYSSTLIGPITPPCCTQLPAVALAQSNIATIFGLDEETWGVARAPGETITSSALTQLDPEPNTMSTRSPRSTLMSETVYREYVSRDGSDTDPTGASSRSTVNVPPGPPVAIQAEIE